jgi:hypothetical protein
MKRIKIKIRKTIVIRIKILFPLVSNPNTWLLTGVFLLSLSLLKVGMPSSVAMNFAPPIGQL